MRKVLKNVKKFIIRHRNIALLITIVLVLPLGYSLAKFVLTEIHEFFFSSKDYYFTSNRLAENNPGFQVDNWSGVENITVEFALKSQKNDYLLADYDIPYNIVIDCEDDVMCTTNDSPGVIYKDSGNQKIITITAVPQRTFREGESTVIAVSATSEAPYVKTISATFEYVVTRKSVTYDITDSVKSAYMLTSITIAVSSCKVTEDFGNYRVGEDLDVTVFRTLSPQDQRKCVSQTITIGFDPNVLLFDNTAELLKNATYTTTNIGGVSYINSITFVMNPLTSLDVKFYKVDINQDYSYKYGYGTSIITFNSV